MSGPLPGSWMRGGVGVLDVWRCRARCPCAVPGLRGRANGNPAVSPCPTASRGLLRWAEASGGFATPHGRVAMRPSQPAALGRGQRLLRRAGGQGTHPRLVLAHVLIGVVAAAHQWSGGHMLKAELIRRPLQRLEFIRMPVAD